MVAPAAVGLEVVVVSAQGCQLSFVGQAAQVGVVVVELFDVVEIGMGRRDRAAEEYAGRIHGDDFVAD